MIPLIIFVFGDLCIVNGRGVDVVAKPPWFHWLFFLRWIWQPWTVPSQNCMWKICQKKKLQVRRRHQKPPNTAGEKFAGEKVWITLQGEKVPSQAPFNFKPSEGEAPLKPPWSPLEAPRPFIERLQTPFKPPCPLEEPLEGPPSEGEAPFKPSEGGPFNLWRYLQRVLRWRWSPLHHWRVPFPKVTGTFLEGAIPILQVKKFAGEKV